MKGGNQKYSEKVITECGSDKKKWLCGTVKERKRNKQLIQPPKVESIKVPIDNIMKKNKDEINAILGKKIFKNHLQSSV